MRINTNYNELDLEYLDAEDLQAIEIKAKGLSLDDCFDFLCVDSTDVPPAELVIAKRVWRRGRASSIASAADNLFSNMAMRGGASAAMDYLTRVSSSFQVDVEQSSSSKGFSFNVVLPEDDV